MNFCVILKPPHDKKQNCPRIRMVISVFQLPILCCSLLKKYTNSVFFQKWTKKIWQLKKQKDHLNLWRIAQLLMQGFLYCIFRYCLKIKMKNGKKKENKKKMEKTLLNIRHQVWHQFGGLWVRGVHWHPLGPHLTPGCPLTPLNLLKVPTEIPWF